MGIGRGSWPSTGVPWQYLQQVISTLEAKKEFYAMLTRMIPLRADVNYHRTRPLPTVLKEELSTNSALIVHPTFFNCSSANSMKGHPEQKVAPACQGM